MQGENFKFVFIMGLSVSLLIAIFLPLLLGVFKPKVFDSERIASLQTVCFGAVAGLGLSLAGYLFLFFKTNNAVLVADQHNGIIFGLVIATLAVAVKLATRPRR